MTHRHDQPPRRPALPVGSGVALLVIGYATAAAFWAWIGWDRERTLGPDGSLGGPLEPWQVERCVLTLLAIGVLSGIARRGWELVVAMTSSLTASWTVWALISSGGTGGGLIAVGLAAVFAGTFAASGLVAMLTDWRLTRRGRARRSGSGRRWATMAP